MDKQRLSLKTLFFDRPRLSLLLVALIVVAGLSSLQVLPRMEDPVLVERWASVFTRYPGADAERVEALVTERIEEELQELEEVKELQSTSRAGFSSIQIELLEDVTDVELAWSLVRDHLADVAPLLPEGALDPELVDSELAARTVIAAISWDLGGPAEPAVLARLAEELEDELRGVPGTMDTKIFGQPTEEIRVEIDPHRLATLGLTADAIAEKIQASDAKLSSGTWRGEEKQLLIELQGELDSVARVASVPLFDSENGRILRLGDVAQVEKTVTDPPESLARISGREGVAVAARMLGGQRVDRWAVDARERLAAFANRLPDGLRLDVIFDQSRYTEARLERLFGNLYFGALLVLVVVLLFMGWRSALLIGSALPLSVLMVFAGMRWMGIALHQMSIAGLIIALGLLIDNAIVIVDEMRRHLDDGDAPRDALGRVVKKLAVPLLGSTLTTCFAFMPLVLSEGGTGEFVGAMSISVILAILSSLFLALTLVPALAALLERHVGPPKPGGVFRRGLQPKRLGRAWSATLGYLVARPVLGVAVSILLPLTGFWAGSQLTEQFFPPADRDMVQIEVELPQGTAIRETLAQTEQVRELLLGDKKVIDVHWFVGESNPKFYYNQMEARENAPHFAAAMVQLTDEAGLTGWMRDTQRKLDSALPSARVMIKLLEQGPPVIAPVEVLLKGNDLELLARTGEEIRRELSASTGVIHTQATLQDSEPQLALELDESEVQLAGLTRTQVARQLEAALEGALGGSLVEDTEELSVRVRLTADTRSELDRVSSLEIVLPGADGATWTPLSSLGELVLQPATGQITRRDGVRTNSVQAWVEAGALAADALADLQARLASSGFEPPAGVTMQIGGEAAERDDAVKRLSASAAVLLVLMAATLVLSFNSFRLSLVIGAVALLAVGLSLGALYVFGFAFGFMAIVGTMGLMGVAINDSIVVLSAIRGDVEARAGNVDAIRRVVLSSTRHVLATTATTIAGFLPLFLSGGSFWPPVAVAIGGGVVGATLLALLFVPSAYRLVACPRCVPREELEVAIA